MSVDSTNELMASYILGHISPEPPYLHQLERETHLRTVYPDMCSGHMQGRMLVMLMRMIRPRYVLEFGTFTGYSALCMAEGVGPDGHVDTVEINDEMTDFIQSYFDRSGLADRIDLHIGDALTLVPALAEQRGHGWDVAFIDANKRHYSDYYRMVKPLIATGGFIIADNTLWHGKLAPGAESHDAQTRGIMEFNNLVAADPDVEVAILPLRDGLTIIHKLR